MFDMIKEKMINNFIKKLLNSIGGNRDIDQTLKTYGLTRKEVIQQLNSYKNTPEGQFIINKYKLPLDTMINILSDNETIKTETKINSNNKRNFSDLDQFN